MYYYTMRSEPFLILILSATHSSLAIFFSFEYKIVSLVLSYMIQGRRN